MSRLFICFSLVLVLMVGTPINSFSQGGTYLSDGSYLLPVGNSSKIESNFNMRGEFLAKGLLTISNEGDAKIGIYVQTLMHVQPDKVKVRVYLDILNTNTQRWETVQTYDFDYLSEDYPDGGLTSPMAEFKVLGKANNYYRLRALHMVWKDGKTESFSTQTDGLLITK